jgi:hypothetical protein
MMTKVYPLIFALLFVFSALTGQRLERFSDDQKEFMRQLEEYMTSSKRQVLEESFEEFQNVFESGLFTEEQIKQIVKTGNAMLEERMTAGPYFQNYLHALTQIGNTSDPAALFAEWHTVTDALLASMDRRTKNDFNDFVKFSSKFFENRALRDTESGGTSWYAMTDKFQFQVEEEEPVVKFERLDLMAQRYSDSIFIRQTAGYFEPITRMWHGNGGTVSWERHGLGKEVYAELGEYEFEVVKSLYHVASAKMHYPAYFGNRVVAGEFSDKLVASSSAVESSFPRFESSERLEVDQIGEGITFEGAFRLQGTTMYGFGPREQPAKISIVDADSKASFRGAAELFTIRREEKIAGQGVDGALYFGQDSIYHPSVDMVYYVDSLMMELTRGDRASDRNPFFSSFHNINLMADNMTAYLDKDLILIGREKISFQHKDDVVFESLNFFTDQDYQQLQSISTVNPIAILKIMHDEVGRRFLSAHDIAKRMNPRYGVENIKSLLYDMVARGFINYNPDEEMVEVKDKVFLYADAHRDLIDYDKLLIESSVDSTNAIIDLKDNSIDIRGVKVIELSPKQRVAMKPLGQQLTMKQNRDMDFEGEVFAGLTKLEGKDFHFEYEPFQFRLDSIRFFDLFVPTGKVNNGEPEALSIGSRIEHATGVLLIDAPSNKSGKDDIPLFPSMQTKDYSYVFYDYKSAQNGAYKRDSFYFRLEPFSFNHLDYYTREDVAFEGRLFSADIFPPFDETVTLQEDESLGFIHEIEEEEGYPAYLAKGDYKGELALSNSGLLGKGEVTYLGASINSEDIIWMPKQMLASAERFDLEENREEGLEVPQVRGIDVEIDWRPYQDSMYITTKEEAFSMFQTDDHTLKGTLILTPGGLKGNGVLDWEKATMRSELFSFGAFSSKADTTQVDIKTQDLEDIALSTQNVKSDVDFDEQLATFKANEEYLETRLPAIQYKTSMNEFTWDMADESIAFKSDPNKPGRFVSTHPDKDSLSFDGADAFYDLKTDVLQVSGVPFVIAADAFVYPDSNYIQVGRDGEIAELKNAKIVADTVNEYHVINRATVKIIGKRDYRGSGFYEYNVADKEQEIEFEEVVGQPVGKGYRSERRVATRGVGQLEEEDEFYIDQRIQFQGTISLKSENRNLDFDGFARLESNRLPRRDWFRVISQADKNDLAIQFDEPKNIDGEPLATGFYLNRETAELYPRIMLPLFSRRDRGILPVKGLLKLNRDKDYFIFGDSSRVVNTMNLRGNVLTYWNQSGKIEGKGRFNLGTGLKYVSVDATGVIKSQFEEIVDQENLIISDTSSLIPNPGAQPQDPMMGGPVQRYDIDAQFMSGVNLIVPDKLLKTMRDDILAESYNAKPVVYLTDLGFFREALVNLLPPGKELDESLSSLGNGVLAIPKKINPYTFLFAKMPMKWDAEYQSFVSKETQIPIISIDGEPLNKTLEAYVEYKMPTNEDDRLYIYVKSPTGLFYFFGFKQGIMSITSNNTSFMDELSSMKSKDLITKMDDGNTYEIQPVDIGTANRFVNRVKVAQQK